MVVIEVATDGPIVRVGTNVPAVRSAVIETAPKLLRGPILLAEGTEIVDWAANVGYADGRFQLGSGSA